MWRTKIWLISSYSFISSILIADVLFFWVYSDTSHLAILPIYNNEKVNSMKLFISGGKVYMGQSVVKEGRIQT